MIPNIAASTSFSIRVTLGEYIFGGKLGTFLITPTKIFSYPYA
jgi:hypothetical protein